MVPDVAEALCSGFNNPPEGCRNLSSLVERSFKDNTEDVALNLLMVLGGVFASILLCGCICAFRKLHNEEVNKELSAHISSAITQYQVLQERQRRLGGEGETEIGVKMELSA